MLINSYRYASAPPPAWQPDDEAGLIVWLKADGLTPGGLASWANEGTLGGAVTSGSSNVVVTSAAQNGLNVVDTDGVDYLTWGGSPLDYTDLTIIAACADRDSDTSSEVHTVFGGQEQSDSFNGPNLQTYNDYASHAGQRQVYPSANGGTVTAYKNNAESPLTLALNEFAIIAATFAGIDALSGAGTPFTIGATAGGGLLSTMRIGELIIYDGAKGAPVLTQAYDYLAAKWIP